jgi:transposase
MASLVQGVLHQDPFTGHLFMFRGRTRANLIKIIYWDGTGFCLFTKRLEHVSSCGCRQPSVADVLRQLVHTHTTASDDRKVNVRSAAVVN